MQQNEKGPGLGEGWPSTKAGSWDFILRTGGEGGYKEVREHAQFCFRIPAAPSCCLEHEL